MTHADHEYRTLVEWSGSTGVGYPVYDRTHSVRCPPAEVALQVSADPAFLGDPLLLNPEQLLVAAAASCQLLAFLAVAARARVDVVAYRDEGWAVMPAGGSPMSIERIVLRPVIEVIAGPTRERIAHLVEVAHRECFIANSLKVEPEVEPVIRFRGH